MNDDQSAAFREITEAIQHRPDIAHFFLEGAGGTGKTYLYQALCSYYRSLDYANNQQMFVIDVASTRIASLLPPGGQTAHSFFAILLDPSHPCKLLPKSERAELLQKTKLIIRNEVPMQNKGVFEAVDRCLQDITKVDKLFGGVPVVFGGNWSQILPVVPRGSRGNIVNACLHCSYILPSLRPLFLLQNMRAVRPGRVPHAEWLQNMSLNLAF